jgi:hypothetical protein
MWQWILNNWHKVGLVILAISHFWDKFERMYNFVVEHLPKRTKKPGQQEVKKPVKMTKKDKIKIIDELIEEANLGEYRTQILKDILRRSLKDAPKTSKKRV